MALGELNSIIGNMHAYGCSIPQAPNVERRKKLRLAMPFPSLVRSVGARRDRFEMQGVLDDLSSCSLNLRLARPVELGARLFLVVRLSTRLALDVPAPLVALQGVVLRTEQRSDVSYGIVVLFTRHRFLYTHPY